jgi:two-component system, chemotaxis family, chemotaxis protein CheY
MSTVLSVDDSGIMRKIIRGAVEVLGLDFLEAGNGTDGLAVLEDNIDEVELVCLDVNMPGMSGIEVLRAIKSNELIRDVAVMMVTTEACRNVIVEAVKLGAVNYVCKPFTQEELTTKMLQSLEASVMA